MSSFFVFIRAENKKYTISGLFDLFPFTFQHMKKILLFIVLLFLTLSTVGSFTYADNKTDVEAIYADKISSIESQMNRAYSDLEWIYATSISNAQLRLKDANDNIKRIQDNYSFQLDLAINAFKSSWVVLSESELRSMAEDSIRWTKAQADTQLEAQEKIVTQITTQIKSLQNEKASKLAQIKSQYQVKIDALIAERTSLIESLVIQPSNPVQTIQPSNPVQTTSTNNSAQITNNGSTVNTNTTPSIPKTTVEKTLSESCQSTFGVNSYSKGINNKNWKNVCACNTGYESSSSGTSCVKTTIVVESLDESCQKSYWINSHSDWINKDNWGNDCSCNSWFMWNSDQTSCIKDLRTPSEICTYYNWPAFSDKSKSQDWFYNCFCNKWYTYQWHYLMCRKDKVSSNKNQQPKVSKSNSLGYKEYLIEITHDSFKKSKQISLVTDFKKGDKVSIFYSEIYGKTNIFLGTAIISKDGKLVYSISNAWFFRITGKLK